MTLDEWAARWGMPPQAIQELAALGAEQRVEDLRIKDDSSEGRVQSVIREEAAGAGWYLWRNNVGALKDIAGRIVRYGLANDSEKLNAVLKSADLVGWKPRLIKVDDVGKILAQFVSRECKRADWRYTGTPEEVAQVAWHTLVIRSGGDSAIVNAKGSIV